MKTCSTCKWWIKREITQHAISKFSVCCNPSLNQDGYNKDAGGYSGADLIPGTDNHAGPDAGDNNGGVWFSTGPDFGCIHHEEKT